MVAEYVPDGVHGNHAGYQIIAEHFAAELVQFYEEKGTAQPVVVSGNSVDGSTLDGQTGGVNGSMLDGQTGGVNGSMLDRQTGGVNGSVMDGQTGGVNGSVPEGQAADVNKTVSDRQVESKGE